ncbi:MAG: GNAT family N-acetyltransferase [Desulfobulbaceae bacterium]|nr:GNAT family N-acetyltransferase [Desulfobulbaceae bacterium]
MIRPAQLEEAEILTDISFTAKRYWNYPEEYYNIWAGELTISPAYIGSNDVWVYEIDREIHAYYSLVVLDKEIKVAGIVIEPGHWLEHMFVRPSHIGHGIGSELFTHLRARCMKKKIEALNILVDPNAREFYQKMGCGYVQDFPSTIVGRTTPHLILSLPKD